MAQAKAGDAYQINRIMEMHNCSRREALLRFEEGERAEVMALQCGGTVTGRGTRMLADEDGDDLGLEIQEAGFCDED